MSNFPLISIIIPTYNRAHLIGETLNSIIDQNYTNWECIIVDDGSTDNTIKVIEGYCRKDNRFQYYQRPENRLSGGNAARNYGYEMSQGEFVNWFDSDDIMLPNFLTEKLKIFQHYPSLDAVLGYGAYFEEDKAVLEVRKPKLDGDNSLVDYVSSKLFFITHGPLWKKSFLRNKVLYDENRIKLQDTEFHFRMLIEGLNFKFYEPDFLFLIRRGDDRISAKKTLTLKKLEAVFNYHYFTSQNTQYVSLRFRELYQKITQLKTLQAFYEMLVRQEELSIRLRLAKSYKHQVNSTINSFSHTTFHKIKLHVAIAIIVLFRKGFLLLR
ncbi:glycosyltransferase family 2 protein [Winogradskyella sp. F6397]|uniref:Glycosyltransferase family 2 protein n=1 Tax=Winogradskyella marina TaxID=2785530 RepID=A0ABS0EKI8_9FLAO|nr:glycosyltransferase family 2 protein [Winogradskyella marina]MBF8150981.1 glycosyltransferase family 2 protein [Winogradskyella marina]